MKRRVTFLGWYIIAIVVVVSLLLLTGCRTQYVSVPEYHYVDKVRTDTFVQRDSIHHHDSVMVRVKGDTVYMERWSVKYRDRWREKAVHDTVIKTDSIRVPYPVERQPTKWEAFKSQAGERAMWLLILAMLLYYIFRKRR